jgi:flagellar basal body-associated protein FliL
MDERTSQKPAKGYGKHSKKYWIAVYLVVAVIVYGLIYLLFIHKGSGSSGGRFNY